MRAAALIASFLLLAAASCVEEDPSWAITWETGGDDPAPPPPPGPQPGDEPSDEAKPADVALLAAFAQDFKDSGTAPFSPVLHQEREDFRYYPAFPSLTELDTDVLLLRLDPADAPSDGPRMVSTGHSFYGSYAFRIRTPDLSLVKNGTDAVFELSLQGSDPAVGVGGIGLRWRLSEPARMTFSAFSGSSDAAARHRDVALTADAGCSPSKRFQTIGCDWHHDGVICWIADPSTGSKDVVGEITDAAVIPSIPAVLSFGSFHTSVSPKYPFELEVDMISYEPYDEEIQAWRDKYFKE